MVDHGSPWWLRVVYTFSVVSQGYAMASQGVSQFLMVD
jgi:hypothetical protein